MKNYMPFFLPFWLIFSIGLFFTACSEKQSTSGSQEGSEKTEKQKKSKKSQKEDQSQKSKSSGVDFEVLVIGETPRIQDRNLMQETLEAFFENDYPALPQKEKWFRPTYVHHEDFGNMHQRHKNILIISAGNTDFNTNKIIKKIKDDASGLHILNDVWARPQKVVLVRGDDLSDVADLLDQNTGRILSAFDRNESRSIRSKIYNVGSNDKANKKIKALHGIDIKIPKNFQVLEQVDQEEIPPALREMGILNFSWIKTETKKSGQHLLIFQQEYNNELQLAADNIMNLRDSIGKYYGDGPNPDSYFQIERQYEPDFKLIESEEPYSLFINGLWRMEGDFMGGPFKQKAALHSTKDKITYIDAFVYAPGTSKKRFIKRMEVVIGTAKIP